MLRRELKLVSTNLKWGKHVQKIRIILTCVLSFQDFREHEREELQSTFGGNKSG